ncbi:MAG: nicotinamide-nucleotide amidohydrolase family protein [Thermoplasmatales archaeon]|nr:nicotinamide-nucleotide amidohydrolase family protein [Thermoplasmatales archaeon]
MDLDPPLARMVAALTAGGKTVAFAESCTGGLAGHLATRDPGASAYFMGSAVVYSNGSKTAILGVPEETLREHGAVSEETALAMAEGARRVYGADIGASVTGIAGPGGGTEGKPVGLVCVAATDGIDTVVSMNRFPGNRDDVRWASVQRMAEHVLQLLG